MRWEGTYKDWVQLPNHCSASQKWKHIFESIAQMLFGCWQAQGINYLSRKPLPAYDHVMVKKLLLIFSLNLPWYSFVISPNVISLMRGRRERERKREKSVLIPHVLTGLNCWILTQSSNWGPAALHLNQHKLYFWWTLFISYTEPLILLWISGPGSSFCLDEHLHSHQWLFILKRMVVILLPCLPGKCIYAGKEQNYFHPN